MMALRARARDILSRVADRWLWWLGTWMRVYGWILAAALLLACTVGNDASTSPRGNPEGDPGRPLLVLAASDLQFALTEIAQLYQEMHGRQVTVTFGSTGNMTQQIVNGAPADIFFAADEGFIDQLGSRGLLLEGTRQLYAIGRLVLVSSQASPVAVRTVDDLRLPQVQKVAIANPEHAPYGRAARQALQATNLWSAVEPKLVLGENISQTFQFVQTGNADAGIVALSLVLGMPGVPYVLIDDSLHAPLRQAAAVIRSTRQPGGAREFLAFVNGPGGRPTMKRYGFVLPDEL